MAIRSPSIYSPEWVFQDNLYLEEGTQQQRFLTVKWDGVVFYRKSQTYDYSNPPYADIEQRGGSIVAQLDYTLEEKLITIDSWEVNWRDEWPLRLAVSYLTNCLYPPGKNYIFRVDKSNYAFWASEQFFPVDNLNTTEIYMGREDDFRLVADPSWLYFPPSLLSNFTFG